MVETNQKSTQSSGANRMAGDIMVEIIESNKNRLRANAR